MSRVVESVEVRHSRCDALPRDPFLCSVPQNCWSRDHWCRAARSLHPASEVSDLIVWQPKSCSEVVVTGGDESQGLALGVTAPPVTQSSELTNPGGVSLVRTTKGTGGVEGRGVVDPAILVLRAEDLDEDDVPEVQEVLQDGEEEGGLVLDQATPQGAATSCTAASGASAAVRTSTKMLSWKPALSCGMTTRRVASSLTQHPPQGAATSGTATSEGSAATPCEALEKSAEEQTHEAR